jgi:hypothetical protein
MKDGQEQVTMEEQKVVSNVLAWVEVTRCED